MHEYHDTKLHLHMLDNIYYPMKSFGGVGALYNDILYGFNGKNCSSSNIDSCRQKVSYTEWTLNISSVKIYNDELYFRSNPLWSGKHIDQTSVSWAINIGTGTSTST